jgi:hypothetical protein
MTPQWLFLTARKSHGCMRLEFAPASGKTHFWSNQTAESGWRRMLLLEGNEADNEIEF